MKLKNFFGSALVATVCLLNMSNAFASGHDGPWGMGGCGFSSLFIKDKGQVPQILASFINLYTSGVTNSSAISSGSSNCVADRSSQAMNEKESFITVNLSSLSKEAAQGSGEHISALAQEFGCPNDAFAKLSQTHYKEIYSVNSPDAVLKNYLKEVNLDNNLSKSCLKVI
jgi:hypothetical protein